MIVIDAGAFLEVLLRSAAGRATEALLGATDCAAPDLLDAEVLNWLIRAEKNGALRPAEVDGRVALLRDAPIERIPSRTLLEPARRFATSLSGYDALYVAAAAALGAPLVTTDARLAATATSQYGVPVTHLPSSGRRQPHDEAR